MLYNLHLFAQDEEREELAAAWLDRVVSGAAAAYAEALTGITELSTQVRPARVLRNTCTVQPLPWIWFETGIYTLKCSVCSA